MSAVRLPLLYAFLGGCLTNAALVGLWRLTESAGDSATKPSHQPRDVAELVTTGPAPGMVRPRDANAANALMRDEAFPEPAAAVAANTDNAAPTPSGSAVSDVLARLETAYRERAQAPSPTAAPAAPLETPAAPEPPPPALATQTVNPFAAPPAVAPPVVAPPVVAPPVVAPPVVAPPVAAPPAVAVALQTDVAPAPAPDAPPATQIHYGDVNQNTYVTNVRQGDVYLIQMQQLAVMQYMQLLGMASGAAPARRAVGAAPHQRSTPFPSGITNPDNPWGFHFSPPNLVR